VGSVEIPRNVFTIISKIGGRLTKLFIGKSRVSPSVGKWMGKLMCPSLRLSVQETDKPTESKRFENGNKIKKRMYQRVGLPMYMPGVGVWARLVTE